MIRINVVVNDGAIEGFIDENGYATLRVFKVQDVEPLVRAINQAHRAGAKRGMMFTGEIVNDDVAAKDSKKSDLGTTWLGGRFTRMPDGPEGPCFRIDWDQWPSITERGEA